MQYITWSFLLFLSFTVCHAQNFTFNQGGTSARSYYEELPYESMNGKMIVYVELAGKKHRFLFDTGAPCAVSKGLAAELNAAVINMNVFKDVNGSTDSAAIVDVAEIKWGNLTFDHIPATTLVPDFYKCWDVDGVIGSNLLRNSIVSISGAKHLIILTDQAEKLILDPAHSTSLITTTSRQSDPVIKIVLKNKVDLTLGFDTGDEHFFRMSEDLMDRLKKSGVYQIAERGYGASMIGELGLQKNADKYLLLFPFLTIGNSRFERITSETNKGGIPAIGRKLLDYGDVTLDFIHGKFYFDATQNNNDLTEKQWPFEPTIVGDKLVVGVVWEKAINEIKPGQQIIAVNDTPYLQVNLCKVLNSPPILAGKETATVTFKDAQGGVKKMQIVKE